MKIEITVRMPRISAVILKEIDAQEIILLSKFKQSIVHSKCCCHQKTRSHQCIVIQVVLIQWLERRIESLDVFDDNAIAALGPSPLQEQINCGLGVEYIISFMTPQSQAPTFPRNSISFRVLDWSVLSSSGMIFRMAGMRLPPTTNPFTTLYVTECLPWSAFGSSRNSYPSRNSTPGGSWRRDNSVSVTGLKENNEYLSARI